MSGVKLEQIGRKFERSMAIDDISLEIPDGEFWVLVGPSGCGKSTLLRIIAGLDNATSGNLYIGDRLVNDVPARQRDVAMVFQNYALYPHMTVAENLGFGLQMRGASKQVITERITTVAKSLRIDLLLDRKPSQLSGGQQQRVALGRSIARSPQVFLLDEPLSNLDATLRDNTRTELKQLHQQVGITTIYVTHDRVEAMTLADRIVVLDRGRIQQIATPQAIYARPANQMVATFMGTPPMNIIPAIYQAGIWQIGTQQLACAPALTNELQLRAGQGFNLGIRPEHLTITPDPAPESLSIEIQVIEPLGREILVTGQICGTDISLNLMTSADWIGRVGDHSIVKLAPDELFVFDASTGSRLFPVL
jgi:multiple sugar transport system ATP-binding protein